MMRSAHYLFYECGEYYASKCWECLIMVLFTRTCLSEFIWTYAVHLINLDHSYFNDSLYNYNRLIL